MRLLNVLVYDMLFGLLMVFVIVVYVE